MKVLLDTCALVWLASSPENLSQKVAALIESSATDLYVSDCSVWEICLKWHAGKLHLPQPPRIWVEEQRRLWHLLPLILERRHFYRASELPEHHKDPFDRVLVSQAIEDSLTIATPDTAIMQYPVATIW